MGDITTRGRVLSEKKEKSKWDEGMNESEEERKEEKWRWND